MTRNRRLMTKTLEELIEEYAFENSKADSWKGDKQMQDIVKANKAYIRDEILHRYKVMTALLDDEQTTENPHGTYLRMING